MNKKHALVVGGTGMLKNVSLVLAKDGYIVSIIARDKIRLNKLVEEAKIADGRIVPIALDYKDDNKLKESIQSTIRENGIISLAVIWIHSIAPNALNIVASLVGNSDEKCLFYNIQGSIDISVLAKQKDVVIKKFQVFPNLDYHQIILGHIKETNGSSHWLTNNEISKGVLEAIFNSKQSFIVGQLD